MKRSARNGTKSRKKYVDLDENGKDSSILEDSGSDWEQEQKRLKNKSESASASDYDCEMAFDTNSTSTGKAGPSKMHPFFEKNKTWCIEASCIHKCYK